MRKFQNIIKITCFKLKTFFTDHFNLLFHSAAENHLRMQKLIDIKPEFSSGEHPKTQNNPSMDSPLEKGRWPEEAEGVEKEAGPPVEAQPPTPTPTPVTNLEFNSFTHLKRYQKRLRIATLSTSSTIIAIIALAVGLQFAGFHSKGATFGWIQASWSGGADTVNFPTHADNQTNWTNYYSKDDNVTAGESVSLGASTTTATQTTDAHFNAWTKTNGYVSSGSMKGYKRPGASCASAAECSSGICTGNVCRGKWLSGPCAGIYVHATDLATSYQWKNATTDCTAPQCDATETYSGTAYDRLSFLNAVDFSAYPARNACKAIGGRLPTIAELGCIYTNRASYGNNFQAYGYYWSSTEVTASLAWYVYFFNGSAGSYGKPNTLYVRCVK